MKVKAQTDPKIKAFKKKSDRIIEWFIARNERTSSKAS